MGEAELGDYAAEIRREAAALRARLASAHRPAERAALVELLRLERLAGRSGEDAFGAAATVVRADERRSAPAAPRESRTV